LPHKHLAWSLLYNFVIDNTPVGMMYKSYVWYPFLCLSPLVLFFFLCLHFHYS